MGEPTDGSDQLAEAPDDESFKRLLAELDADPAFHRRLEEVERLEAAGKNEEAEEAVSIREYFRQLRGRRDVRPVSD